jgi:membrane carboxypeptidase/penicillin-binding protein
VATVWFGYDVPRRIAANASGGRLAAPAWAAFYRNGWRERSPVEWLPPAGLVSRRIDEETFYLANEWCPSTRQEWFKPGTEPVRFCPYHDAPLMQVLERVGREVGEAFGEAVKDLLGL